MSGCSSATRSEGASPSRTSPRSSALWLLIAAVPWPLPGEGSRSRRARGRVCLRRRHRHVEHLRRTRCSSSSWPSSPSRRVYLLAVYRLCKDRGASAAFVRGFQIAIPVALVLILTRLAYEITVWIERQSRARVRRQVACLGGVLSHGVHLAANAARQGSAALLARLLRRVAADDLAAPVHLRAGCTSSPSSSNIERCGPRPRTRCRSTCPTSCWSLPCSHRWRCGAGRPPTSSSVQRAFAPGATTDSSTLAHTLLLEYALQLKTDGSCAVLPGHHARRLRRRAEPERHRPGGVCRDGSLGLRARAGGHRADALELRIDTRRVSRSGSRHSTA